MMKSDLQDVEDFDYWLVDMDDALERFFALLPASISKRLDYSPASLNAVEEWLLTTYPHTKMMMLADQAQNVDGAARYIGETFRKAVGGYWSLDEEDSTSAYYGLPVLENIGDEGIQECPLVLASTSVDRRSGKFLLTMLQNYMEDLGKH